MLALAVVNFEVVLTNRKRYRRAKFDLNESREGHET